MPLQLWQKKYLALEMPRRDDKHNEEKNYPPLEMPFHRWQKIKKKIFRDDKNNEENYLLLKMPLQLWQKKIPRAWDASSGMTNITKKKITPPPRNAFSEMTKKNGKKLPRTRDAFSEMTKITKTWQKKRIKITSH